MIPHTQSNRANTHVNHTSLLQVSVPNMSVVFLHFATQALARAAFTPSMISCHPSFQAPKLQGGSMRWLSKSHKVCLDFGPYESYERKFPFQVPTTQQFNFRASRVASPPKKCHVGLRKRKATFQFCFSAGSM